MKRISLSPIGIVILMFFVQPKLCAQKIIWEEIGQLPMALFGAAAVKNNSCVYLIGGQTGNRDGRLNTIFEYNFKNGLCTEKAKMQTEKLGFVATLANNKIYAIRKNVNEEYNPKTNQWTLKSPIPEGNVHLSGCAIKDKIYVINKNNWVYDPINDSCENFASMNTQVGGMSIVLNSKLYVIGGLLGGRGNEHSTTNFEMYDPSTDQWEKKADLPMSNFACAPIAINNKIIIIGGHTVTPSNEEISDKVYMYNPKKDKWKQLNDFVYPINWASAIVYKNFIYVFGGANSNYEPYSTIWRGKLN